MSDGGHYGMITAFYCIPQRVAEESSMGECCFFKREGEREREKGRDLFALQKPGRELS